MIDRRVCTTCKIEKPFEEFGNSKKGKWGKREICKDCKRIKDREYGRKNPDKMTAKHSRWVKKNKPHLRDYNRERYAENPGIFKERSIAYRKRTENKTIKKYKDKYPLKKKAHLYVELAVFYGDLIRPENCSKCGIACKAQGHHHDYSKPLDVMWLCTKCHGWVHRTENTNHAERLSEKTSKEEAIV